MSFKFLTTKKLTWSTHTRKVVKRARQRLFSLRRLKRLRMGLRILKKFYSCTIEQLDWLHHRLVCTTLDHKMLQRVVRTAQYITGTELPAIQDLYIRRCQRKA
jgi:hypothetical protein